MGRHASLAMLTIPSGPKTLTVANAGGTNSATSSATLVATNITAAVGDMLVVFVAADNAGSSGASSTSATMTDSAGNTYTRRSVVNRTAASAANDGVTLSIFTAPVTTALSAGSITANFSPNTTAKAMVVKRVTPSAGATVQYVEVGTGASGSATTQGAPSHTVPTSGDTIFGASAVETSAAITGDSDTTNGSWSATYQALGNGGTSATSATISVQQKTVTASGVQNYASTTASAADYAANTIILRAA